MTKLSVSKRLCDVFYQVKFKFATAYFGEIRHPTIDDIAVMIYDFWRAAKEHHPALRWEDMRIWKMDLRGAHTLLSFRPQDVGLFSMLVSDDLVNLQMVSIFGWSGCHAYNSRIATGSSCCNNYFNLWTI
jgi:hypothetical protein